MSKKKNLKNTPADDLIESLLEDVNSSPELPSEYNSPESQEAYSSDEESGGSIISPGISSQTSAPKSDPRLRVQPSAPKENSGSSIMIPDDGVLPKASEFWDDVEKEISLPAVELADLPLGKEFSGSHKKIADLPEFEPKPSIPATKPEAVLAHEDYPGSPEPTQNDEVTKPEEGIQPKEGKSVDRNDDRTVALQEVQENVSSLPTKSQSTDVEKTIAVTAFANRKKAQVAEEKVVVGVMRGSTKPGLAHISVDASLAQAENLKIAQQRILELEKELDRLRTENEELASAGQIIRQKSEDLTSKILSLEKEKNESVESLEGEILILRGSINFKDSEIQKYKIKIEDLETRLRNDFMKIRVRERELENRLELARAEKHALIRAKDDTILELQRKIDHVRAELETYRGKVQELNKTVEGYQEQMKRTVRALRLALTNLEVKDESVLPLKKAE